MNRPTADQNRNAAAALATEFVLPIFRAANLANPGRTLSYFVENDGPEAVRIHFLGGRFGAHAITVNRFEHERVAAHASGYVEAQTRAA